jgi:pyroglutamyl-peptidase
MRVMLTGFEPFDGRPQNDSWEIANATAAAKRDLGDDVVVTTCHLPVVYDTAAHVAESCFDQLGAKPDVVISLGEAGCQLRMETAAHNKDDTPGFPDNAGNIRSGIPIEPGGPDHLGFNLPAPEMYCALNNEQKDGTEVSETPGGFVCNNTAFRLGRFFEGQPVQYGFIHVPASSCSNANPKRDGKILAKMLRRLAKYDDEDLQDPLASLPHCSNDMRLPTDSDGAASLISTLSDLSQGDCRREFLERLKERL